MVTDPVTQTARTTTAAATPASIPGVLRTTLLNVACNWIGKECLHSAMLLPSAQKSASQSSFTSANPCSIAVPQGWLSAEECRTTVFKIAYASLRTEDFISFLLHSSFLLHPVRSADWNLEHARVRALWP